MHQPEAKLEALLRLIVANIGKMTIEPEIQYSPAEAQFSLRIDGRDQGRFIGKQGKTIGALQTIFWYAGLAQIQKTAAIKLLEPEDRLDRRSPPFTPNPNWDRKKIGELIDAILKACFNHVSAAWVIEDNAEHSVVQIQCDKYLQAPCSIPSIEDALKIVIHAAGMANGANLQTEVTWR